MEGRNGKSAKYYKPICRCYAIISSTANGLEPQCIHTYSLSYLLLLLLLLQLTAILQCPVHTPLTNKSYTSADPAIPALSLSSVLALPLQYPSSFLTPDFDPDGSAPLLAALHLYDHLSSIVVDWYLRYLSLPQRHHPSHWARRTSTL